MFFKFSELTLNSAEERQNSETALFTAEYLRDFNPGNYSQVQVSISTSNDYLRTRNQIDEESFFGITIKLFRKTDISSKFREVI